MKLLLNMNLPRDLCEPLAKLGCECAHVRDLGMSSSDDEQIVRHARASGQTILTHDLDYGDLLAFSGESGPSVVIFRMRDVSLQHLVERFTAAWPEVQGHLNRGAVVTIGDQGIRVRRLPIRQE